MMSSALLSWRSPVPLRLRRIERPAIQGLRRASEGIVNAKSLIATVGRSYGTLHAMLKDVARHAPRLAVLCRDVVDM